MTLAIGPFEEECGSDALELPFDDDTDPVGQDVSFFH